jgi:hypothetical protein
MIYATPSGSRTVFETGKMRIPQGNSKISGIDHINEGHLYGRKQSRDRKELEPGKEDEEWMT